MALLPKSPKLHLKYEHLLQSVITTYLQQAILSSIYKMSPIPPSTQALGSLPQGWSHIIPSSGLPYFTHQETNIITYYDPRKPNPHPAGFAPIPLEGAPLPTGWEILGRRDGQVTFLNHNLHTATNDDPRVPAEGLAGGSGDGGEVQLEGEGRMGERSAV